MNELAYSSEEVYRGHFEECIHHLAKVIQGFSSTKKAMAYKALADFCGVTAKTTRAWIVNNARPNGIVEIKFNCLLDLAGYRVIELENMQKPIRNFYELMGFGVVSPDEVMVYLHYSSKNWAYSSLTHGNPEENRKRLMWDKWKEKKDELQQNKVNNIKLAEKLLVKVTIKPALSSDQEALKKVTELLKLLDNGAFSAVSKGGMNEVSVNTVIRLAVHLNNLSKKLVVTEK